MFRRVSRAVLTSAVAAMVIVPATLARAQEGGPIAPELTGLGTLHMPVTTSVPQAQRFFDQGLRLLYAFNHAEAIRAFREAARLDPGLAMAHWGWAIALGPNLNAPMTQENGRQAYAAIRQARALSDRATPANRHSSRRWRCDTRPTAQAIAPPSTAPTPEQCSRPPAVLRTTPMCRHSSSMRR